MNRETFLKQLGGAGLVTLLPITSMMASNKIDPVIDKKLKEKIVLAGEGKQISVLGDNQTFKLTGKDTNGLFTLIEQSNEPGFAVPLHVHDFEDEVFKILQGEVEFIVGNKTKILKEGDTIFLPRKIPHGFKNVGSKKAKVILNIFPSGLENMFIELDKLPPGQPDFEKVEKICGKYGVRFV